MKRIGALSLALLLVGCSSPGLPYRPVEGSGRVPVSAVHQVTNNRFYVELATEGYRVETAVLVLADGSELSPETLHHPAPPRASGGGFSVGIGSGVVGRNAGVGVGAGIDSGGAGNYGHTVAIYPASKVGKGPWRLRVNLLSFAPVEIELPALDAPEPAG